MKWDCDGISEVGDEAEENEDTIVVDPDAGICVVADGMGGHAAGATASREAATFFLRTVGSHAARDRLDENVLRGAVGASNRRIRELGQSDPQLYGLGTTLSAVVYVGSAVRVVHIGDSRVYHVSGDGVLRQVTRDHTLVRELVEMKHITAEDAEHHRLRYMLSRAIGSADDVEPDIAPVDVVAGDWLLLASDGLEKAVPDADLARFFSTRAGGPSTARQLCIELLALAKRVRLTDNTSFVALHATG